MVDRKESASPPPLCYSFGYVTRPFFAVYWQAVAQWNREVAAGLVYALPGGIAMGMDVKDGWRTYHWRT